MGLFDKIVKKSKPSVFILILLVGLISVTFSYNHVFASHDGSNPPKENIRTEPFRYYIIYVAMERDCSKYDDQILGFFRALVPAYLHKYGFYYITEKAECINASGDFVYGDDPTQYGLDELAKAVKRGEEWGRDLTVIVFDRKSGDEYTRSFFEKFNKRYEGHYYWKNYEHIVTKSTFGYRGESDYNALVLSEEISHFVLSYLGYPKEISGGHDTSYVHANRIKYMECLKNDDLYSAECSKTWTTIEGSALRSDGSGYYVATFRVLAPYDKPIPKPTVPQVDPFESKAKKIRLEVWNEYFEILSNIQSKQQEINALKFQSQNAKNDLQNAINTLSSATAYFEVVKHNLDVADNLFNRGLYEPAFNTYDSENDTLTSIKNLLFDISRSINSAKANENKYHEQKQPQEKTSTAEQSQYKLKVTNLGLYDNNSNLLSNPTINNAFSFRFEIENPRQNHETAKIYVAIIDDKGYRVTTMETTDTVVTSGQSIIVSTNYWKPDVAGKYVAVVSPAISSKDNTLIALPFTVVFDIQPNSSIEKELRAMEEDIRAYENTLNEKIIEIINAHWESEQKFSTSNAKNRMKLAFEKASSVNGKIASTLSDSFRIYDAAVYDKRYDDAMEIINNVNVFLRSMENELEIAYSYVKEANNIESKYQNQIQTQTPTQNLELENAQYKTKAFDAKSTYQKKIASLKSGIDTAIKSLTGLVFENVDAKKKINYAWDLAKNAQQRLTQAEEKLSRGQFYLDNNHYKLGFEKFNTIDEDAKSIGNDLKTISQLIDEAKMLVKPKTCFLFWCW